MALPLTGFEISGDDAWTTLENEPEYLSAVAALSARVRVISAGVNAAGRALRVVEIAHPFSHGANMPTVLFVAQQHGAEAAGREALLQLMREWATTSDPAIIGALSHLRVVCIQTANPDGLPGVVESNGTYTNASGINVNRDAIDLRSAEARLIQQCITAYRPIVVVDSHELGGTAGTTFLFKNGRHPSISPAVEALSYQLQLLLQAHASEYPGWTGGEFMPDTNDPTLVRVAGWRHAVSMLLETAGLDPTPRTDRVAQQKRAFEKTLEWASENIEKIVAACSASRVRGPLRAASGGGEVMDFGGGAKAPDTPSQYFVTDEQRATYASHWDVYGLPAEPADGGVVVSVDDHYPVVNMMMDPMYAASAFDALPQPSPPPDVGYGPQQKTASGYRVARRLIADSAGWRRADVRVLVGDAWQ